MSQSSRRPGETVTIQLVDSSTGRVVQVWELPARELITIGRAPERDISIADPYVSRHHADLRWSEGTWMLVALSRNGVLVHGRDVKETPLADGTPFRLGGSGPLMKFYTSPPSSEEQPTLSGIRNFDELIPQVDTAKRDEEVRDIVESDFFSKLKERANQLRQQRPPGNG